MDAVAYYIERARAGDTDAASHGLRELDRTALPALREAYQAEGDPTVRAVLVEAIWQHREPSAIDFLGLALADRHTEVWKQALDGLVTLASPESRRQLESSIPGISDAERRAWIEEAIGQIDLAMAARA